MDNVMPDTPQVDTTFKHKYLERFRREPLWGVPHELVLNEQEFRNLIDALDNFQARIERLERENAALKAIKVDVKEIRGTHYTIGDPEKRETIGYYVEKHMRDEDGV